MKARTRKNAKTPLLGNLSSRKLRPTSRRQGA